MRFPTMILLIACIVWGVLLGGVVYSHMVFMPVYLSDLPNSAAVVNGAFPIREEYFWMTIHPIILVSLITTIIANRKHKQRRNLVLITLGIYVTILVITALHFVPELIQFKDSLSSTLPAEEWKQRGHNWLNGSLIRGAVLFIIAIPLFKALSLGESRKAAVEVL